MSSTTTTQTLVLRAVDPSSDSPFLNADLQSKLRSENPLFPLPDPAQSGKRDGSIAHAPKRLHSLSAKDQKVSQQLLVVMIKTLTKFVT